MAFQMIFLYHEMRTNFTLVCNHVMCHDRFIKFIRGPYMSALCASWRGET